MTSILQCLSGFWSKDEAAEAFSTCPHLQPWDHPYVTSHPSGGESRRKDAQRPQRGSCCSPVRGMKGRPLGAIFRAAAFGARGHDDHDDERDGNHRET
jgi:hypothetical protein